MPEVCPRCAPGGCARDVPQVCFVPEVCPRCAPGVPEIVPQVCPRCAPGVHRQITELPSSIPIESTFKKSIISSKAFAHAAW